MSALLFGQGKNKIARRTAVPHRGHAIVVTFEAGDLIGLRLARCRRVEYVTVAAIFDLAVKQRVAHERAQKRKGRL